MGRRRGFFAEVQYQAQQAEKRQQRAAREQERARAAQEKAFARAQREAERARAQAARAAAAERKALEKEAARLHLAAREAEVESLNAELEATYDAIDSILAATLDVDDFVDLNGLRSAPDLPSFADPELETPESPPLPIPVRPEPAFVAPEEPSGLSARLGGAGRHAKAVSVAQEAFAKDHQRWQVEKAYADAQWQELHEAFLARESQRQSRLEKERALHEERCSEIMKDAEARNAELDALATGLAAGDPSAVDEYVGIVLANSAYPDEFPIDYDYEFVGELGELELLMLAPVPTVIPTVKAYKYVKSKDEITSTALTKGAVKERYTNAIAQVAIRSIHEVFEADRRGVIKTISMAVAVDSLNPATGLEDRVFLAACAAEREAFLAFDLTNVVPAATLEHLGGQLSKNAYELRPIDMSLGVREV